MKKIWVCLTPTRIAVHGCVEGLKDVETPFAGDGTKSGNLTVNGQDSFYQQTAEEDSGMMHGRV